MVARQVDRGEIGGAVNTLARRCPMFIDPEYYAFRLRCCSVTAGDAVVYRTTVFRARCG